MREQRPVAPRAPVKPVATAVEEAPKERPKLVLLPRTAPLEERHYAPASVPVAVTPAAAVQEIKPEPVAPAAPKEQRRKMKKDQPPTPVAAAVAPVVVQEDDFFTKPNKKTIKPAPAVQAKETVVTSTITGKAAASLKNRFKGLVESESDEQN
jgi:hypothetical protein